MAKFGIRTHRWPAAELSLWQTVVLYTGNIIHWYNVSFAVNVLFVKSILCRLGPNENNHTYIRRVVNSGVIDNGIELKFYF